MPREVSALGRWYLCGFWAGYAINTFEFDVYDKDRFRVRSSLLATS